MVTQEFYWVLETGWALLLVMLGLCIETAFILEKNMLEKKRMMI